MNDAPPALAGLSLHARLRQATAARHRSLDAGLRYVLGPDLSLERYARLLAALYGFYVPLEASMSRLCAPLVRRTPLLERDLRVLGREPARARICDRPPRLATLDHLAGAFYVVEGACLGGQVIARAVRRQLGVRRDHGAAFFSGDGAAAVRWKAVLAWLEARERGARAGHEITEGACRTFAALSRWLSAQGVLDE
jgi:heme oxygenase (biliverdin-IX-beta and delta-forming)